VTALTQPVQFLYRASANKWWFDDINNLVFVVIGGRFADAARLVRPERRRRHRQRHRRGHPPERQRARRVQTGRVQNYALGIASGSSSWPARTS
jgi:hypothetical protein